MNSKVACTAMVVLVFLVAVGCAGKKGTTNSYDTNTSELSSVAETTSPDSSGTIPSSSASTPPSSATTSGRKNSPVIYVPDKGLVDDDVQSGDKQTTTTSRAGGAPTSPVSASSPSTTSSTSPSTTPSTASPTSPSTSSTTQSTRNYDVYTSKPSGFAGGVY